MTVKDILNMDFDDLVFGNNAELRRMLNTLNSAARKRVKRLEAEGLESYSPALAAYGQGGFSAAPKSADQGELIHRIERARLFLMQKNDLKAARGIRDLVNSGRYPGRTWHEIMDWIYKQQKLSPYLDALGSQVVSRIAYNAATAGWSADDIEAEIMSAYNDMLKSEGDNNEYYNDVMSQGYDTDYGAFLDEFEF